MKPILDKAILLNNKLAPTHPMDTLVPLKVYFVPSLNVTPLYSQLFLATSFDSPRFIA